MKLHPSFLLAALSCLALLAVGSACGDDSGTGGAGGDGGSATNTGGSDGGGGTGGEAPATVELGGAIRKFVPGVMSDSVAVANAEVCFLRDGPELCTQTDQDGEYLLRVPANTVGGLRVRADGLPTNHSPVASGTEGFRFSRLLLDHESVESVYAQAGVTVGPSGVLVLAGFAQGVAMSLNPSSGQGPYYYLSAYTDELDLEATTTGPARTALYLDVDPNDGPFTAGFMVDDVLCTWPQWGAPFPAWTIPDGVEVVTLSLHCN